MMAADRWELVEVEVHAFRGVKNSLVVTLRPGLNVLFGGNGAGKTTICHAVEWCLFGRVPTLTGDEFQNEDAIYHRLSPANGSTEVRLSFRCMDEHMTLTRTRRRGSSSTRGSSALRCEVAGATHMGRDAEAMVLEVLGLSATELSSSAYLRQDTVTELVTGDEDIRNAAIDKLIGIGQIRQLLENLQLSAVDRAVKQIDEEIKSQEENVLGAAVMRRVQLARRREALIDHGFAEATLSIAGGWDVLRDLGEQLAAVSEGLDVTPPSIEPRHGTVGDMHGVADSLTALVRQVESKTNDRELVIRQRVGRLEDLAVRFREADSRMTDLRSIDLDEQNRLLAELARELHDADERAQRLNRLRRIADSTIRDLDGLVPRLIEARLRVEETEAENLSHVMEETRTELASVQQALDRESALSRLLVLARDYVSEHQQDTCPVCQQAVNPARLTSELESLVSVGGAQSAALNQQLVELQRITRTVDERLSMLQQHRTMLDRDEIEWARLVRTLSAEGLETGTGSIAEIRDLANTLREEDSNASDRHAELEQQHTSMRARIAGIEDAQAELLGSIEAVINTLGVDTMPADIPSAIEAGLQELGTDLSSAADVRRRVGELGESLADTQGMITYLRDVDDVAELEQQVPPVRRRMRQLQAAKERLDELRRSAQEIYNALTAVQEETLSGNLAELVPTMQEFFGKLGSHPEFRQLVIEPAADPKRGTTHYSLRAETEQAEISTFVRSTFSRAELNAVALALFLAVAQASDHSLGVALLDDPSQSFDPLRQRALADVLRQFAADRQVVVTTESPELVAYLTEGGAGQLVELAHQPFAGTSIVDAR